MRAKKIIEILIDEVKRKDAIIMDLHNRLMAREYSEYKSFEQQNATSHNIDPEEEIQREFDLVGKILADGE